LQEKRIRRVGAADEIAVDARVIAATNRDIKGMVETGDFRQDLYYRLSVIPLCVPPLRERREDISDLANHFIKKFCARSGKNLQLSAKALEVLCNRPWHGNVRELEHAIERAVALTADGEEIPPNYCTDGDDRAERARVVDLPEDGLHLPTHISNLERDFVAEALRRTGGNQTRAAQILQIPVHALRHLVAKHKL
jgi:two-component system response regulator PilR (NtrC family)